MNKNSTNSLTSQLSLIMYTCKVSFFIIYVKKYKFVAEWYGYLNLDNYFKSINRLNPFRFWLTKMFFLLSSFGYEFRSQKYWKPGFNRFQRRFLKNRFVSKRGRKEGLRKTEKKWHELQSVVKLLLRRRYERYEWAKSENDGRMADLKLFSEKTERKKGRRKCRRK